MPVKGLIRTHDALAPPRIGPPRFDGRYLSFEQLRASDDSRFPKGPERSIDLRLSGNMAKYVWLMNDFAYITWPAAWPARSATSPTQFRTRQEKRYE